MVRGISAPTVNRRGSGTTMAAVVVIAGLLLVMLAQQDLIYVEGRVLWVAGGTMVVAPYTGGSGPINVDLSQASQDEYMALTTGASVTVAGTVAPEGDRIIARSIRERS